MTEERLGRTAEQRHAPTSQDEPLESGLAVHLTINGRKLTVPKGITIIQAAR
ncbi:MAG: hypothetical protein H5U00_07495, partial [Clostridia bacterium]|nr:hypothetical protein [Clostridia bacterium]